MISIAALIYRSPSYADALYESLLEFTPYLKDGRARFFFVANDPTPQLLRHLQDKDYPHLVNDNGILPPADFDPPEYIRRTYRGWNRAVMASDEIACIVSSDNLFSPGWLEGLEAEYTPERFVSSKIVERNHPKYGYFRGALRGEFGDCPRNFKKDEFLAFCDKNRLSGWERGGCYNPAMFSRTKAMEAGMFPEGNPRGTYGDKEFCARLDRIGVKHVTALSSLVYHFKEGEMSE